MKKMINMMMLPLPYVAGVFMMVRDALIAVFLEAIDSFAPKDDRLYKSKFDDIDDFLSPHNDGICLDGWRCLTRKDSAENVLVTGSIGSGKGVVIVVNNIIRMAGSRVVIVNDPSHENAILTSGFAATKGRVVIYDWNNPSQSDSFNPLDWIRSKSDAYKVASILAYATQGTETKDPFWTLQSINVLFCFISITLLLTLEYRNFSNVKYLVSRFGTHPDEVDYLFVKLADKELLQSYYSLVAMSENVQKSVIATVLSCLSLWNDENVERATASSSFSFLDMRKIPCTVYVQNNTVNSKLYAPLIEIFYEQMMGSLFSTLPDKSDLDCVFIMDEASTTPLKNSLNAYLNNGRKYRLNFLQLYQSAQIASIYGSEASSIKGALRTKVWLPGAGLDVSAELETLLGKTEDVGKDGKRVVHPLMLAEDIRQMNEECVIVSPQGRLYRTPIVPFYKQPFINMKTKIPPYLVVNALVPDVVPLIQLYAPPKTK